ncbi:YgfZ/GcvT domain-containing protein [Leptospira interrogans]
MTDAKIARLADRGVVRVTGEDAAKLLDNLITADLERLDKEPAVFGGLLTPQGKILFDFFVVKVPDGYLLETSKDKAADFAKRLTFYKLRAKAAIADVSGDYEVFAAWDGEPAEIAEAIAFPDPRNAGLGWRLIAPAGTEAASSRRFESVSRYHTHRVTIGMPEGGRDYVLGDAFPHEALFDQIGGVNFDKGCYVGQEVVSRMQHRSTARKRVVPIEGPSDIPAGAEVKVGEAVIGSVGSSNGTRALALVRLDRVGEAIGKGQPVTAGGTEITVKLPDWVRFTIPMKEDAAKA